MKGDILRDHQVSLLFLHLLLNTVTFVPAASSTSYVHFCLDKSFDFSAEEEQNYFRRTPNT